MKIINPKNTLDSSKITLGNPIPIQGGSYFTKLKNDDDPLYAQMPKCLTKKGIIHTEKNDYCDLMYERNGEEQLIEWIENIENCCQDLIDKKKHVWFHTELSRDDISTMMTPMCRIYKSGKNILIRVNIEKNKHTSLPKCIAYDEDETLVDIDTLTNEHKIIPLICIDGIKFTSRSFEICITLQQFMIFNKEKDLEKNMKCMISIDKTNLHSNTDESEIFQPLQQNIKDETVSLGEKKDVNSDYNNLGINESLPKDEGDKKEIDKIELESSIQNSNDDNTVKSLPTESNLEELDDKRENNEIINNNEKIENVESESHTKIIPQKESVESDIQEINLDICHDDGESIQLKNSDEVYYEIYKEAKRKAKEMRESALKAYLEAEKIKMKFSLDGIDDDSDFDDSVSESSDNSDILDNSENDAELPMNLAEN